MSSSSGCKLHEPGDGLASEAAQLPAATTDWWPRFYCCYYFWLIGVKASGAILTTAPKVHFNKKQIFIEIDNEFYCF